MIVPVALLVASVELFGPRAVFQPPLANPRSPEFFAATEVTSGFTQFWVAMGARLPLVTWTPGLALPETLQLQVALDGGIWSDLGRSGKKLDTYFPVFAADYLAGLSFMARYGGWSTDLEVAHISAHLVDGSFNLRPRIVYSREYWRWRLSRDFVFASGASIRVYAGYGHMVRVLPRRIGDWMLGGGLEVVSQRVSWFRPFLAVDVTYNDDAKTTDLALQWGTFITRHDSELVKVRLALEYYEGSDRRGQFLHDKLQRLTAGLYGRF